MKIYGSIENLLYRFVIVFSAFFRKSILW